MSIAARFRKTDAILWRKSAAGDGYGDIFTAESIKVNYLTGGKLTRDSRGQEFTPSATISAGVAVATGDMIRIRIAGEPLPAQPDGTALTIRQVTTGQPLRGVVDYLILTA